MNKFKRKIDPKEAMSTGKYSLISREKFIQLFLENFEHDFYTYEDMHDFSLGMKKIPTEDVKRIASDFYDQLMDEIES